MTARYKLFEYFLPLLLLFIQSCNSDKCDCEGFFCLSDSIYQLCVDGETVGDPIHCNTGNICRNETNRACDPQLLCQNECRDEGIFPDNASIYNYFECIFDSDTSEFIKKEFTCPEGSYFSNQELACVTDEDSQYVGQNITDTNGSKESSYSDGDIITVETTLDLSLDRSTTKSYKKTEIPSTAPQDDKLQFFCPGPGLFPNFQNCQHYYRCSDTGTPLLMSCPDKFYYDEEIIGCRLEVPSRCKTPETPEEPSDDSIASTVPPETTTASLPDDTTITSGTPETPKTEESGGAEFSCPGTGYFADPENCQNYYICLNREHFITGSCSDNTYFDEDLSNCTSEIPARCQVTDFPSEDATYTPTTPLTPTGFLCLRKGYFADPENCQRYYVCFDGSIGIPVTCPLNTYFNEDSSFCTVEKPERCHQLMENPDDHQGLTTTIRDDISEVTTSPPISEEFACPERGYFADPKNCHRYFVCNSKGVPISLVCPGNSYYDDESTFCILKKPARCNSEQPDQAEPSDDQKEIFCPTRGTFADPQDCTKYWICYKKNLGYSVSCSNGTYYHEDSTLCEKDIPKRCTYLGSEKFKCPGQGYFADSRDCQMYHLCYFSGLSTTIRCPRDTYYDEKAHICTSVIPERCKAEPNFNCNTPGIFPDPSDCTQFYFCDLWGGRSVKKCPIGRYFDERLRNCTSIMPDRCLLSTPPMQHGFICPGIGYYADPNNCSAYHVCNYWGDSKSAYCPKYTYFHENIKMCLPGVPNRCKYSKKMTTEETIEKDVDIKNFEQYTTSSSNYSENNGFVCPGQGLFADPEDCRKFYVCYGRGRHGTCRYGTYYNEETEECTTDIPERCKSDNNDHSTLPPQELPDYTPAPDGFTCPGEGLFPDPEDCRKFYVCYGRRRHVTCRFGTYYNEETRECSLEVPDRCGDDSTQGSENPPKISTTPLPTPPGTTFRCETPGRFPDPEDCQRYYVCNWRLESRHLTCKYETYFNDIINKCQREIPDRCRTDKPQSSTSTPPVSPDFQCPSRGNFPDAENCHNYYSCLDRYSEPIRRTCPANQYFNAEKGKCKKNKKGSECWNPRYETKNSDESFSSELSEDEDFDCERPGVFPDLRDCKKYFICTEGLKVKHKTCNGSTHFNELIGECSYFPSRRCRRLLQ